MELRGASVIITGGTSGLGAATAVELSARGARVVLVSRGRERRRCEVFADELGGRFVPCDVTDDDQILLALEAAAELGPLRALVTSAGRGWASRTIGDDGAYSSAHDLELFRSVVNVNLLGTFNVIRLVGTAMSQVEPLEDGERGAIVTVGSGAAFHGQVGQAAYAGSKAAVQAMTLPLARELAPCGIRVNCIAPGLVETPIYGKGPAGDKFRRRLRRDVLFPDRFGYPSEFARLAAALLCNRYMNGEVIRFDAGARLRPQ